MQANNLQLKRFESILHALELNSSVGVHSSSIVFHCLQLCLAVSHKPRWSSAVTYRHSPSLTIPAVTSRHLPSFRFPAVPCRRLQLWLYTYHLLAPLTKYCLRLPGPVGALDGWEYCRNGIFIPYRDDASHHVEYLPPRTPSHTQQ